MKSHTGGTVSLGEGSVYFLLCQSSVSTQKAQWKQNLSESMTVCHWWSGLGTSYKCRDSKYETILFSRIIRVVSCYRRTERHQAAIGCNTWTFDTSSHDGLCQKRRSLNWILSYWAGEMVADFFTKPLQGSLFWKSQKIILNLPD
jgi:hypothetical protein